MTEYRLRGMNRHRTAAGSLAWPPEQERSLAMRTGDGRFKLLVEIPEA